MKTGPLRLLAESWLILLLASVFGASLAAVNTRLSPRIDANRRAETLRQVPALVLGIEAVGGAVLEVTDDLIRVGRSGADSLEIRVKETQLAGHRVLGVSRASTGERLGWVVHGEGQGYADTIELLIGLDPNVEVITGLYVLSQKETPALGDGITKEGFRRRFIGRPTAGTLTVVPGGDPSAGIMALTAATISSQSVCDIVNRAVEDVTPGLSERPRPGSQG